MSDTEPCRRYTVEDRPLSTLHELVLILPRKKLTDMHSVWARVRAITGLSGDGNTQRGEEKRKSVKSVGQFISPGQIWVAERPKQLQYLKNEIVETKLETC